MFPALGARPLANITAPQLLAMAKGIEARGALDIAKRALQTCGQIMRYAVARGLIERNPAADVRPSDALKSRKKENHARLDAKDMPELMRKIEAYQGHHTIEVLANMFELNISLGDMMRVDFDCCTVRGDGLYLVREVGWGGTWTGVRRFQRVPVPVSPTGLKIKLEDDTKWVDVSPSMLESTEIIGRVLGVFRSEIVG